ncbi:hypothetical protein IPH92_01970 [Candidatus Kaiserbacteria bacterium]|nr:MAG: hypothetical protein IPH92_01970 [Candidatus Kaiserbacteria bacterium]
MAPRPETTVRVRGRRDTQHSFVWQIMRGVLRLFAIGAVLGLVWYVTRLPFFTITDVTVSGGETISHEEIRTHVRTELQGAYFLIVPKQFTYLYPKERVSEVLLKNPRIHDVVLERTDRHTLNVSFKEYVPYALWCGYSASTSPCYFVTEGGYAFALAPTMQGGALPRHILEGVDELHVGDMHIEKSLSEIEVFMKRVSEQLNLRIASVLHKKNGDIEFSINGGGAIFVTGKKDLNVAFDNLTSVLASDEFKHIEPGNFKYIDVRFENKVFVNEKIAEESTTTVDVSATLPE